MKSLIGKHILAGERTILGVDNTYKCADWHNKKCWERDNQPVSISNCPPLSRKRGDIKSHSSVRPSLCLSVRHKNFNLGHNFCTITGRALILDMCILCDKTFPMVPCCDLDGDL